MTLAPLIASLAAHLLRTEVLEGLKEPSLAVAAVSMAALAHLVFAADLAQLVPLETVVAALSAEVAATFESRAFDLLGQI